MRKHVGWGTFTAVALALTLPLPATTQAQRPVSTWTSAAYGAVGAEIMARDSTPRSAVIGSSLAALSVAAAGMHGHGRSWGEWPSWQAADHAGLHAVYGGLAADAWGAPWWATLAVSTAAPALLEARLDVSHVRSVAVYSAAILAAGIKRQAWKETLTGAGLLGAGLAVRSRGDMGHGAWHVLTALGTRALYEIRD